MHLITDGTCKNKQMLTDTDLLRKWLLSTVAGIGMKVVSGPHVVEFEAAEGEYKGLTGIVVLAESHISVHTFPELDYAFVDVFSCFPFDAKAVGQTIERDFSMKIHYEAAITRGIEAVKEGRRK